MQDEYYEENMGLYTQLITVITFGGPHNVALLCMLQTHWFEVINRLWIILNFHGATFSPNQKTIPINSFLFRINNYLPCRDLIPGPPGEKLMTYQCANVLL